MCASQLNTSEVIVVRNPPKVAALSGLFSVDGDDDVSVQLPITYTERWFFLHIDISLFYLSLH